MVRDRPDEVSGRIPSVCACQEDEISVRRHAEFQSADLLPHGHCNELLKYGHQVTMDKRYTEVCVIDLSLGSWATMSMMSVRVTVRRIPSDRRP